MLTSPAPSDPARRPGLRARWLVAGTVVLATVVGFDLATVASAAPTRSAAPAAAVNGEVVGGDPTVRPGQRIELTVAGFAPDAAITVGLTGAAPATATADHADGRGELHARYTVPALTSGDYLLVISGPGAADPASPGIGASRQPRRHRSPPGPLPVHRRLLAIGRLGPAQRLLGVVALAASRVADGIGLGQRRAPTRSARPWPPRAPAAPRPREPGRPRPDPRR